MEDIEAKLVHTLKTSGEVVALVGDRIFPLIAPQRVSLPYITYQRIDSVHHRHTRGLSQLSNQRIQFNCWSLVYSNVKDIAEAVRRALDATDHVDLGSPGEKSSVNGVFLEDQSDDLADPSGGKVPAYRVIMDFMVWRAETVA